MQKTFRKGPMGSLIDEYEKAILELKGIVENIDEKVFMKVQNPELTAKLHTIKDICDHIIRAGYRYSNYIRSCFQEIEINPEYLIQSPSDMIRHIDLMFAHTLETVKDKYALSDDQFNQIRVKTHWEDYSLEGILEHAIAHILRHRRQIELFLSR